MGYRHIKLTDCAYYPREECIEDAEIVIDGGILKLSGQQVINKMAFDQCFISESDVAVNGKKVKYGYATLKDWYHGIKSPYISSGWYQLAKREPFQLTTSHFTIIK